MAGDEARPAAGKRSGGLRGMLRRITVSQQEFESQELRRDSELAGSRHADQVRRGDMVKLTGRLRTVVYTPRTNLPTLEADLYDGTDAITLVFVGRRQIVGIEPGRYLTARGRVAIRDGRKVIYNPYYELEAAA